MQISIIKKKHLDCFWSDFRQFLLSDLLTIILFGQYKIKACLNRIQFFLLSPQVARCSVQWSESIRHARRQRRQLTQSSRKKMIFSRLWCCHSQLTVRSVRKYFLHNICSAHLHCVSDILERLQCRMRTFWLILWTGEARSRKSELWWPEVSGQDSVWSGLLPCLEWSLKFVRSGESEEATTNKQKTVSLVRTSEQYFRQVQTQQRPVEWGQNVISAGARIRVLIFRISSDHREHISGDGWRI